MKKRKLVIDRNFWEGEKVIEIMDDFCLPDETYLKEVVKTYRKSVTCVPRQKLWDWFAGRRSLGYVDIYNMLEEIKNDQNNTIYVTFPRLVPIYKIMDDLSILMDVGFTYGRTQNISKEIFSNSQAIVRAFQERSYKYLTYSKVLKICYYLLEKLENALDFVENGVSDYILVPDI